MATHSITLAGRQIDYRLKRSARRRTIGLSVGPDGLCVTLPARSPAREAERALAAKSGWVLKKLERWSQRSVIPALEGRSGEEIGYLGGTLELVLEPGRRAATRVLVEPGRLIVRHDETLDGDLKRATVRRALERWRKRTVLDLVTPMIAGYARELGQGEPAVRVRVNRSRWGSCASDGTIRMNARLLAYPTPLIDYVCAHEACHLIEMNHSKRFYALLDSVMADHRARARALSALAPPGVNW